VVGKRRGTSWEVGTGAAGVFWVLEMRGRCVLARQRAGGTEAWFYGVTYTPRAGGERVVGRPHVEFDGVAKRPRHVWEG
jgi:hypothetical protein